MGSTLAAARELKNRELSNLRAPLRLLALAVIAGGILGCAAETIVHGVNEKEANQIIEVLAEHDVIAQKVMNNTGREVVYDLTVPGGQRLDAIKLLNQYELPRRRDKGYQETFSETGLIPTSAEEKAKKLSALEGEIERQIKLIDGVLDVQVQIVMPDESALRTTEEQEPTTTASVTIKYMPGEGGLRPVSEPEVQAIVAAGVEKLLPENVVVLMRPARGTTPQAGVRQADVHLQGLQKLGAKKLLIGLAVLLFIIALLGLGIVFFSMQLRTVRGRLIRLQHEIAKARRRPGEALPPAGQAAS